MSVVAKRDNYRLAGRPSIRGIMPEVATLMTDGVRGDRQVLPQQLKPYPQIELCQGEECIVHDNCNSPGKRPVYPEWTERDRSWLDIKRWVNHSDGNYGTVCTAENDLVVIDSDEPKFKQHIESNLPETFTVRTANGHCLL